MNVSKEHLAVLLLAKHSGDRFFADFFGKFSFFVGDDPLSQTKFSTNLYKYENIDGYKKIACIDNPYRIVYQEFLSISSENWKKKTNLLEKQQKDFTRWFDNIFYNNLGYLSENCHKHQVGFLFCNDFSTMEIDYVVKKESYFQDLQKIPFVDVSRINSNLDFLVKQSNDYQKVLNREQAKKIFDFYRPYFDKFEFDPFSFTNQELSLKEKVDFIHS